MGNGTGATGSGATSKTASTQGTSAAGSGTGTGGVVEADGMVLVPKGPFLRGCKEGVDWPPECWTDPVAEVLLDVPQREIWLSEFWIDQYELTVEEYEACVSAGGCTPPEYGQPEDKSRPVTGVTWDQARTYCEWRGKRLPSEAEWEKAARGPDGAIFPWGDTYPDCDQTNVLFGNEDGCADPDGTEPVDARPRDRSPYGAVGMMGNAQEWTNDWASLDYYEWSPDTDPPGPPQAEPPVPGQPNLSNDKIARGSYYMGGPDRITRRSWVMWEQGYPGRVGLRCASSVPPDELPGG